LSKDDSVRKRIDTLLEIIKGDVVISGGLLEVIEGRATGLKRQSIVRPAVDSLKLKEQFLERNIINQALEIARGSSQYKRVLKQFRNERKKLKENLLNEKNAPFKTNLVAPQFSLVQPTLRDPVLEYHPCIVSSSVGLKTTLHDLFLDKFLERQNINPSETLESIRVEGECSLISGVVASRWENRISSTFPEDILVRAASIPVDYEEVLWVPFYTYPMLIHGTFSVKNQAWFAYGETFQSQDWQQKMTVSIPGYFTTDAIFGSLYYFSLTDPNIDPIVPDNPWYSLKQTGGYPLIGQYHLAFWGPRMAGEEFTEMISLMQEKDPQKADLLFSLFHQRESYNPLPENVPNGFKVIRSE